MTQIFENNEFRLLLTGHDYDFVGIIETKTEEPLTFYFNEVLCDGCEDSTYWEDDIDESKTRLLGVHQGLKEYNSETDDPDDDEEQNTAEMYYMTTEDADHIDYFRTRDDRSTGFLSDPRERGQFLAIVKNYCPERLKDIAWA